MNLIKIMPCLDMKEGRVVQGVHFVDIRDADDPVENAAFYEKEGADDLAMLDIAATLESRKTRLAWVEKIDKNFLFSEGSIGWLFLLVKGYFASVLHQKVGDGDAFG